MSEERWNIHPVREKNNQMHNKHSLLKGFHNYLVKAIEVSTKGITILF